MPLCVIVGKSNLFPYIEVLEDFNLTLLICRALARKLTYSLAAAFQEYSKRVKAAELSKQSDSAELGKAPKKKFAIDLRTPEEMQQEIQEQETEA